MDMNKLDDGPVVPREGKSYKSNSIYKTVTINGLFPSLPQHCQ